MIISFFSLIPFIAHWQAASISGGKDFILIRFSRKGALKTQVQHLWGIMSHGKNLRTVKY